MSKTKKIILSLVLAVIMMFSFLPGIVMAADGDDTKYYDDQGREVTDASDGYVLGANGEPTTTQSDAWVAVSKTATALTNENEYEITLTVDTKSTEEFVPPDAASVVLVLDMSGSMYYCAKCGAGSATGGSANHADGCIYGQGTAIQASQTRYYELIQAAIDFIDDFADKNEIAENRADRYVSIVIFGASGVAVQISSSGQGSNPNGTNLNHPANGNYWLNVSDTASLNAVKTYLGNLKPFTNSSNTAYNGYHTNYEAGLAVARNLYIKQPDATNANTRYLPKSIENNNVIFFTDGEPTQGSGTGSNTIPNAYNESQTGYVLAGQEYGGLWGFGATRYAHNNDRTKLRVGEIQSGSAARHSASFYAIATGEANLTTIVNAVGGVTSGDNQNIYRAANSAELAAAFAAIGDQIGNSAEAKGVIDPMSEYVIYDSSNTINITDGILNDNLSGFTKITYTAPNQHPLGADWVRYQYTYKVTLDTLNITNFGASVATNGNATFTYTTDDEEDHEVNFPVPEVSGLRATPALSFTKTGSDNALLSDVVFTLTHDASECGCGHTAAWTRTATSNESGIVTFGDIPSGHKYTLKETTGKTGYFNAEDIYYVTVSNGTAKIWFDGYNGATMVYDGVENPTMTVVNPKIMTKYKVEYYTDDPGNLVRFDRFWERQHILIPVTDTDVAAVAKTPAGYKFDRIETRDKKYILKNSNWVQVEWDDVSDEWIEVSDGDDLFPFTLEKLLEGEVPPDDLPEENIIRVYYKKMLGDLQINKTITGAHKNEEEHQNKLFTFEVVLTFPEGLENLREINIPGTTFLPLMTMGTTTDGRVTATFEVKASAANSVVITGIPAGTRFVVIEKQDDNPGGYSVVGRNYRDGTIRDGNTSERTFENEYDTEPANVNLTAKKIANVEISAGDFSFGLYKADGTTLIKTAANAADGTVTFPMTYTFEDDAGETYTYVIKEIAGSAGGWTYDEDSAYTVTVEVIDNGDGTLSATVTYEVPALSERTFENEYDTEPANVNLTAKKIANVEISAGDFSFGLYKADGTTLIKTAANAADGTVTFPMTYTFEDDAGETYTYVIKEIAGSAGGWTYDEDSAYTVTVEVIDNGDGTLSATVTYDNMQREFNNIFNVSSLTIQKYVTGTTADDDFTFNVELTFPSSEIAAVAEEVMNRTLTWDTEDDTKASFEITVSVTDQYSEITIDGIPAGTTYKVTEQFDEGCEYELTYINGIKFAIDINACAEGVIEVSEESIVTFTNHYGEGLTATKETDRAKEGSVYEIGEIINYTITVTNNGTTTLYDVIVTDPKFKVNGVDWSYTIGELEAGQTIILDADVEGCEILAYEVTKDDVGLVTNRAYITYGENTIGTNFADAFIPGIKIEKIADKPNVFVGSTINYTIKVTNIGGVDLTDIIVVDSMIDFNPDPFNLDIGESIIFNWQDEGEDYAEKLKYTVQEDDENIDDFGFIKNTAIVNAYIESEDILLEDTAYVEVRVIELGEGDLGLQKIVDSNDSDDYANVYEFLLTFEYDEAGFIKNILDSNILDDGEDDDNSDESDGDKALRILEKLYDEWQDALAAYEELKANADDDIEGIIDDKVLEDAQKAYDDEIEKARTAAGDKAVKEAYDNLRAVYVYDAMQEIDETTLPIYEEIESDADEAYIEYLAAGGLDDEIEFKQNYLESRYHEIIDALKAAAEELYEEDDDSYEGKYGKPLNKAIMDEAEELARENAEAIFQPDDETLALVQAAYDDIIDNAKVAIDDDSDIQDKLNNALLEVQKTSARYENVKKLYDDGDFEAIIELMMNDIDYIGDTSDTEKTEEEIAAEKAEIEAWIEDIEWFADFDGNSAEVKITVNEDGSYTIFLKHGDIVIFKNIPKGVLYTLEETDSNNADKITWQTGVDTYVEEDDEISGISGIMEDKVAIACKNFYEDRYATIVIRKIWQNTSGIRITNQSVIDSLNNDLAFSDNYTLGNNPVLVGTEYSIYEISSPDGYSLVAVSNNVGTVNKAGDIIVVTFTNRADSPTNNTTEAQTATTTEQSTTTTETVATTEEITTITENISTTEPTIETTEAATEEEITDASIPQTNASFEDESENEEEEVDELTPLDVAIFKEPEEEETIDEPEIPYTVVEFVEATEEPRQNPQTGNSIIPILLMISLMGAGAATFMYTKKRLSRTK